MRNFPIDINTRLIKKIYAREILISGKPYRYYNISSLTKVMFVLLEEEISMFISFSQKRKHGTGCEL